MAGRKRPTQNIFQDMWLNIIVFFVLMVLIITAQQLVRTSLLKNAYDSGTALTRNYASEEQGNLDVCESLLSFGASTAEAMLSEGRSREYMADWMVEYFDHLQSALGKATINAYLITDGSLVDESGWKNLHNCSFASTAWYKKVLNDKLGRIITTDVYIDTLNTAPIVTIAKRCGELDSVLAFDIYQADFASTFHPAELSEKDSFFLCDSKSNLIYRYSHADVSESTLQTYASDLVEQIDTGRFKDYKDYVIDLDGDMRAVYYTVMPNGWYSIITVPYSDILKNLNRFTLFFYTVGCIFLLLLVHMTILNYRTNEKTERTNDTVRVLGNSYYALYRINYQKETYEMIKGSDYIKARLPMTGSYDALLKELVSILAPDDYREYVKSFSCENIRGLVSQRIRDYGGEFQRRFDDGYKWVSVRVLFDESLSPEEVVLCYRIIEEEKQNQLRERKLLEDALESSRRNEKAKQQFFNNMSHDMRTPLNAIIGFTELAQQNADDQVQVIRYLKKIAFSGRQLLNLVNDILDMSRIEQGKLVLNNHQFDLQESVEECLETFRLQAKEQGKTLDIHLNMENTKIFGDPFRISQVLNNLLSNAFKFTPEGGKISVSVEQIERGDVSKYKTVVSDTGVGMSPEFLPKLFDPYTREQRFRSSRIQGTGLGMSITKNLVSQMSGEIHVESQPGVGTTFTVIIPFMIVRDEEPKKQPKKSTDEIMKVFQGLRVLLAEDNAVNMEIARTVLRKNGAELYEAWNGKEALERFEESEPFFFDIILMDMQMPQMDGCESAKRIRALKRDDAKDIPIIAVTANAFSEDIAATTAAGMDAHVSKPIDFKILGKTVSRLLDEET